MNDNVCEFVHDENGQHGNVEVIHGNDWCEKIDYVHHEWKEKRLTEQMQTLWRVKDGIGDRRWTAIDVGRGSAKLRPEI